MNICQSRQKSRYLIFPFGTLLMFFSFLLHSFLNAVADPQSLLEEKEAVEEKLAISEYELRLAQEDILKLKTELQKKAESPVNESRGNFSICAESQIVFLCLFLLLI